MIDQLLTDMSDEELLSAISEINSFQNTCILKQFGIVRKVSQYYLQKFGATFNSIDFAITQIKEEVVRRWYQSKTN